MKPKRAYRDFKEMKAFTKKKRKEKKREVQAAMADIWKAHLPLNEPWSPYRQQGAWV